MPFDAANRGSAVERARKVSRDFIKRTYLGGR
jgi:hypothetical protein